MRSGGKGGAGRGGNEEKGMEKVEEIGDTESIVLAQVSHTIQNQTPQRLKNSLQGESVGERSESGLSYVDSQVPPALSLSAASETNPEDGCGE